jgi:hypothetical protein
MSFAVHGLLATAVALTATLVAPAPASAQADGTPKEISTRLMRA